MPANDGTNIDKSKNQIVYAENFVWTFDKQLIPVGTYTKAEAAKQKHLKIEYDKQKRPRRILWTASDMRLKMLSTGKDVYEIVFNYSDSTMTQSYLNKEKELTNDYYGICKMLTTFDKNGKKLKEQYFDKNMQAATDEYGNHKYVYRSGNTANERFAICRKTKEEPPSEKENTITYKLDEKGVATEHIWTDKDGNRVLNEYQYAALVIDYNNDYRLMRLEFLNENNKLCKALNYNCAYAQFTYNTDNKPNTVRFYNADGSEAKIPECDCARTRNIWPPYGEFNYLYDIRMNH
jgi:hypothetical protein